MKSVPLTILAYCLGLVFSLMTFYMIVQVFTWSMPAGFMVLACLGAVVWYVVGDELVGEDPADAEPIDSYSKVFLPSEAKDFDIPKTPETEKVEYQSVSKL